MEKRPDLELCQIQASEQEEVTAFLRKIFHAPADERFVRHEVIRWKFFDPRPDWEGSRSYALFYQGAIVAHGCLCPITFLLPEHKVKSLQVIDWAAVPACAGAGMLLMQQINRLIETRIGIGGTNQAVALVRPRRVGLHSHTRSFPELRFFVRPVRPWRRLKDGSGWRPWARLGRDLYRWGKPRPRPRGWDAQPVTAFDASMVPAPGAHPSYVPCERTPALLNYFLQCPAAQMRAYRLTQHNQPRGYALLAIFDQQARIAELQIDGEDPIEWRDAYATLLDAAAADPQIAEVLAGACPSLQRQALLSAGFSMGICQPVNSCSDSQRRLVEETRALNLGLFDGDAAYI